MKIVWKEEKILINNRRNRREMKYEIMKKMKGNINENI